MALISYYKQPEYSNSIDLSESPYTKAHTFEIEVTTSEDDKQHMNTYLQGKNVITGIIEELPEISYSTSWGDSPAAVVNDKIKKFTQNKWIKMFAYQNENYNPPLLTDGWTQQFPKAAEPLSVSLKFRAYPIEGYYNTTHFQDIVRALVFVSTPQKFELSDTMDYMAKAGTQAKKKGGDLADVVNDIKDALSGGDIDFKGIASALAKKDGGAVPATGNTVKFVESFQKLAGFIDSVGDMSGDSVGGCPLIKLKITDLIYPTSKVKWILKSWSFKPSLQVTFDNNPIYVDFNVTLQTQYILSTEDLATILGLKPATY